MLKLTLVDGPSWHNNFGDGALNYYKGFPSRIKSVSSRYHSVLTRTPVMDSFGCFSCPNHTQIVRKVAIRWLTTHPDHINPFCFELISYSITVTCNRFVDFCWFPFILAILANFEQEHFWSSRPPKKGHQEGIGIHIRCLHCSVFELSHTRPMLVNNISQPIITHSCKDME